MAVPCPRIPGFRKTGLIGVLPVECLTNPQLHFMIETQGWLSDQAVTRNPHLKGPNTSVLMALGFLRGFFPHQTIPWQPEPLVNKLTGMREMHLGKHVSKK